MEKYIIIIAIVHAYLFAIMFFSKKKVCSRILGFYMLNFFIQSFLFANFHIFKIQEINVVFYLIISGVSLLDWPLMYLYVRKMSEEDFKLNFKSYLHLLPGLILFLFQIIMFISLSPEQRLLLNKPKEMLAGEESLSNFMSGYSISVSLLFLQWLFYSIAMIIKLIKHRRNIAKQYSYTDKISLNWLFAFVILYLTYFLIEIAIYLFPGLKVTEPMYFSIVSLHIFIVGIWGLRQKDIYTLREKQILPIESVLSHNTKPTNIESINTDIEPFTQKESAVSTELEIEKEKKQALLSESQKLELSQKITEIMERERLYLNPELSLDDLSAALMIHKNYVSYVINDVFKINFYNYINRYRIEEAKRMLLDRSYDNLSIEGIAKSCGYKSRNVFYPVFKKMEGITPMEFKKNFPNQ